MVLKSSKKITYLILAWLFLVLAIIGIPLPILPTTPFLILSAYFFSHSSPKLHNWLLNLKYIGPMIFDWEKNKVIGPKAKFTAVTLILTLFGVTVIYVNVHLLIKISIGVMLGSVIVFILSRNTSRQQ